MGFVIDDPTTPQDVGEAAKKFFNDGSNINCRTDWSPKCCPLFAINNHVLDWLSKPERERYSYEVYTGLVLMNHIMDET